jgi:hypothetical protein
MTTATEPHTHTPAAPRTNALTGTHTAPCTLRIPPAPAGSDHALTAHGRTGDRMTAHGRTGDRMTR